MKLTPEQAAAVMAREPRVAVVAGAGTGKTRVLVERYLHLVLDRGVALQRILAVTFTEKAAREMKQRIRAALAERGALKPARAAEFAPVSTIHAFLSRTLRERALDAGLDPRFAVADEITANLYLEQALDETIDGLDEERRGALAQLPGGEEDLLALYGAARATPHAMRDLTWIEPDLAALRSELSVFLDACAGQRAAAKTQARLETLRAVAPRLLELDPEAAEEFTAAVKGGVAKAQRELFREGRELAKRFAGLVHLERGRCLGAAVVEALVRLDRTYTESMRADGLVDFADLEREGLALLRSPAGAEVRAGIDHLLVDEYQDTSRIQQAILDRLAEGCELFGVGDEKQSIYRFRYADAQVFRELQEGAARYPLGGSFRSRPELVRYTNRIFRELFEGRDVQARDLRAERTWPESTLPAVESLVPEAENAPAGRRLEARALAARLREIATDPESGLEYGDCAILLRATTQLAIYERALADAGVPYVVVKGRGYYAAREVVDLAHLLLLLEDPYDDFRAVAALTSLFCGATEGDLLHLAGDGPLPLRALDRERPTAIPEERWKRLQRFGRRFLEWRKLSGRATTGALVGRILEQTGFAALQLLRPDGRRRYANVMKARRQACRSGEDPATFARALLEFRQRERRESEAPISAETDQAVQLMTVHASKGLEFPLVAVVDLTRKRRNRTGPILRPDGVFGVLLKDEEDTTLEPPGFDALKEWDQAQEEAEEVRLLYVALTRAERRLIVSGALYPRAAADLMDRLAHGPGVEALDAESLARSPTGARGAFGILRALLRGGPPPASAGRDPEGARTLLAAVASRSRPEVDASPYVAAVADLVEFARCPRRYRLKRMLGLELDEDAGDRPPVASAEHPRRLLGTVFHELMQAFGPGAVPEPAQIKEHFSQATPRDLELLTGWCEWLASTEIAQRAEDAPQKREMTFLARVEGLAVQGVIDLYLPGVPLLADYKTGRRVGVGDYDTQVAVYLAALRSLGFDAPPEAHLVYVDAQEVVRVTQRPISGLVGRFREAHKGAGFAPTPGEVCEHCEFHRICPESFSSVG